MVSCDLAKNKVMHKALNEVESQLAINTKFMQDKKNLEIEVEVRIKKASRVELKRSHKKLELGQKELVEENEHHRFMESQSVTWQQNIEEKLEKKKEKLQLVKILVKEVQQREDEDT